MSNLSSFTGVAATKGLVNLPDSWAVLQGQGGGSATGTSVSFGATTANVYKSLVSITGSGFLDWLAYVSNATTSRVVKIRVTIDGTVVFTSTSGTITTASAYGRTLVGLKHDIGGNASIGAPLRFNASLLIEVQDNVGGTIDQWINYAARTE